eukprot:1081912-Pyramimonas_sp.AAC.1
MVVGVNSASSNMSIIFAQRGGVHSGALEAQDGGRFRSGPRSCATSSHVPKLGEDWGPPG